MNEDIFDRVADITLPASFAGGLQLYLSAMGVPYKTERFQHDDKAVARIIIPERYQKIVDMYEQSVVKQLPQEKEEVIDGEWNVIEE